MDLYNLLKGRKGHGGIKKRTGQAKGRWWNYQKENGRIEKATRQKIKKNLKSWKNLTNMRAFE